SRLRRRERPLRDGPSRLLGRRPAARRPEGVAGGPGFDLRDRGGPLDGGGRRSGLRALVPDLPQARAQGGRARRPERRARDGRAPGRGGARGPGASRDAAQVAAARRRRLPRLRQEARGHGPPDREHHHAGHHGRGDPPSPRLLGAREARAGPAADSSRRLSSGAPGLRRVTLARSVLAALLIADAANGAPAQAAKAATAAVDREMGAAEGFLRAGEMQTAESHYRSALLEAWMLVGTLERIEGHLPAARDAFRSAATSAVEDRTALQALALL